MIRLTRKAVLVPGIVAGILAVGMPSAGAQSLLESLFGSGSRSPRLQEAGRERPRSQRMDSAGYSRMEQGRQQQQLRQRSRPQSRAPVQSAKISAPAYYNYKAVALQRVDFAPLAAIGQSASLDQATSGTAFREAVGGLAAYELYAEPAIAW